MPKPHRTTLKEDPATVIALIYRIVDEPRRAATLVLILLTLPVLAVFFVAPASALLGIPPAAAWLSICGTTAVGFWGRQVKRYLQTERSR
jgi:hypothetical protein